MAKAASAFEIGEPALSSGTFLPGGRVAVAVPVTNVGHRPGAGQTIDVIDA